MSCVKLKGAVQTNLPCSSKNPKERRGRRVGNRGLEFRGVQGCGKTKKKLHMSALQQHFKEEGWLREWR